MTNFRRTTAALTLAVTATMGMSACNFGSKEAPKAKDAWNKSQDTLGKYKSLEVKADGKSDGKPASLTLKGEADDSPIAFSGTLDGAKVEGVSAGGKQYVKGDAAYWKKAIGAASSTVDMSKLANVWVTSGETKTSSDTQMFTDMIKEIRDDSLAANKKLLSDKATVTEDKVDGKDAWKIESEDKKVMAWVSQNDNYDVLKTVGIQKDKADSKDEMTTVTFLSHDKDYGIKAPSDAKSIKDVLGL